jgi:RNA polymerase sigma-70 factor (ECF subfamily)
VNNPRPDSEHTVRLLERAVAGDRTALNQLLAEQRDGLRAIVAGRLDPVIRKLVDPSDVVQEALAEIARRLPDFAQRRPMPFHLWVRKEAYERALNLRRFHLAECRDVTRDVGMQDDSSMALIHTLAGGGPTPSEDARANELAEHITAAVNELAESDREILILRQVDQLPYDEVAALLDIKPATARQRYGRALLNLKDALAKYGMAGRGVT